MVFHFSCFHSGFACGRLPDSFRHWGGRAPARTHPRSPAPPAMRCFGPSAGLSHTNLTYPHRTDRFAVDGPFRAMKWSSVRAYGRGPAGAGS